MHELHNIETQYRKIISEVPHPESRALIEELERIEPRSMAGFPPVVWDRAEGFQVWDAHGNKWIDFTASVVLANAGHAHPRIGQAIREQLDEKLWHNYCNPSEIRLRTVQAIKEITPPYLDKVFLLTTGSEAVECAIKLMRLFGRNIALDKIHILSYYNSFHGRTMASQTAGGYMDQQEWMVQKPGGFHHIPFPECARCPWGKTEYERCGRECVERGLDQLRRQGVDEDLFAGIVTETFQGPTVAFMPDDYVQALREWADKHQVLLVFDEIQAGFGRTGRWFGFEHYGVEADLICIGKGMTSCLPMSALAGRGPILDVPSHGEMSSTHTGNPLCCAATIANIKVIREERLIENAAAIEPVARQAFERLRNRFPEHVGTINGKGLAWAIYLLDPVTKQLDPDLGNRVTTRCMELGLLMLSTGRGTLKIAPPLCISKEAFLEGIQVIEVALGECARTKWS
jgi:4-aminobutyrate aminotransferase-like enzyme